MALKPPAASRAADRHEAPPGGWPTPRALYVHVPFCRHRCGYCNFSVVSGREDLVDRFLAAIDRELAELGRPLIDSLFVGGGTPTHLPPPALERLLQSLAQRVRFAPGAEYSVEANPEDVTAATAQLLKRHGVNRVSLGVQSFDGEKLRTLERGHDGATARRAIEAVAEEIPNVSIDLIFAAPGESLTTWRSDLATALRLPIVHLSTYALTFEKGTSFWSRRRRGECTMADESLEVAMYERAREFTAAAGWEHYEISNFAKSGFRCRHNLAYWTGRGWFGVGPGAARFCGGRREVNHRSTTTYLKRIEAGQSATAESEAIGREQLARERAAFGVRMLAGIDLEQLRRETGVDVWAVCGEELRRSHEEGLVEGDGPRLALTERGVLFADTVASRLLG